MNYLFQGDKGYTIPELFAALRSANLEFICMVNQRDWDLMSVFQEPQALPKVWEMSLPELSIADRLQLFELIAPVHRLLDFWCGHQVQSESLQLPQAWPLDTWETVQVYLHPQLQTAIVKASLIEAIGQQRSFNLSQHLSASAPAQAQVLLSPHLAACLLPLWDASQPFLALVQRVITIRPCNPVTLEPTNPQQAAQDLREALIGLEMSLHVLLERR
ncbi:hypothetical protein [Phormidesmis priestleyi]